MKVTITIEESENGKPSITVKEEGKTDNSKSENPSKNQNSKEEKPNKKEEGKEEIKTLKQEIQELREFIKKKPKTSKVLSEKELAKRRKDLLKIRDNLKKDIEISDDPAELRRELEMLEQTLIEYKVIFKEIG